MKEKPINWKWIASNASSTWWYRTHVR